jgi:hypothetical protein
MGGAPAGTAPNATMIGPTGEPVRTALVGRARISSPSASSRLPMCLPMRCGYSPTSCCVLVFTDAHDRDRVADTVGRASPTS